MQQWLIDNGFYSNIPGSYSISIKKASLGVSLYSDGRCLVMFDGEIVWQGDQGEDAKGVIKEYLDL